MKKWKVQFSALLVLVCIVLAGAKIKHHHLDGDDDRKAMHKEMMEYAQKNIIPVLKEQRLKLEKRLSAEDKATITKAREEFKAAHEARKGERKKMHERMKSGEFDREKMHEHFKKMKEEHRAKLAPITAIAEKHEKKIEKLLEVAETNKETWKEGMEDIRRKYISDEELEKKKAAHKAKREERKKEGEHHGKHMMHGKKREHGMHKRHKRGGHHMKMLHKLFTKEGFLLWDPNAPMPAFDEEEVTEGVEVYPNPSKAQNKIDFSVTKEGPVKIELLDKQGNILKTVLNESKSKGDYSIDVNLSNLPNAIYYYRITTVSGTKTTRFLIDK